MARASLYRVRIAVAGRTFGAVVSAGTRDCCVASYVRLRIITIRMVRDKPMTYNLATHRRRCTSRSKTLDNFIGLVLLTVFSPTMKIVSTLLVLLCCLVFTGRAQQSIPLPGANLVVFHTGTTLLAATYNDGIAIITSADGSIVHTLKTNNSITALAWSPDGSSLAFGCKDGSLRLWNTAETKVQTFTSATSAITALEWNPDGTQITVGTATGLLEQRDGQKGKTIRTLKGHTTAIADLVWTKDELRAVDVQGTLTRWKSTTGTSLSAFKLPKPIITAAWSPNGAFLLSVDTTSAIIRDILTGMVQPLGTSAKAGIRSASWDAHSTLITTVDNEGVITVWEALNSAPFVYPASVRVDNAQSLVMIDNQHIAVTNTKDIILYDLTMVTEVPASLAAIPTLQVYPNPIILQNSTVALTVGAPTHVQLTVVDLQGREIATLCNERLPAGQYTYTFGNVITAPGIYLLRLVTPQGQKTVPLVIVR